MPYQYNTYIILTNLPHVCRKDYLTFFDAVSQHTPVNGGNHKKVNYPIGSHRLGRVDETNKDNCCATCFQEDYKFTNFGFWVFTLFEAPGYIEKKQLSN